MEFASSAIQDADALVFMIDATRPNIDQDLAHDDAFSRLTGLKTPVFLVINKVDAIEKQNILPIIDFVMVSRRVTSPADVAMRAGHRDIIYPQIASPITGGRDAGLRESGQR